MISMEASSRVAVRGTDTAGSRGATRVKPHSTSAGSAPRRRTSMMQTGHPEPPSSSSRLASTQPRLGSVKPRSKLGVQLADLLATSPHMCMAVVTQQMERLEREMEVAAEAAEANEALGPITAERLVEEAGLGRDEAVMAELFERIQGVRDTEASTERAHAVQDLLYTCCMMCFAEIGLALTPNLHHGSAAQMYATAEPQQLTALLHAHTTEAMPVVQQYLTRLMNQPEPMLVGAWQMRMPPMEGRVMISIPHVFLLQMYDASVLFGYGLRRAQQVQQLDRSLGMRGGAEAVPLAAQASFDDTFEATVSTMETTAAWPLAAYLPHARVQLKSAAAHALCGRHTAALFGSPAVLQLQMDAVLAASASAEDAQERLDGAMRGGQVAWLNISVSGLERLMLEAVLFGRVLNDVERTFDIEYGLV